MLYPLLPKGWFIWIFRAVMVAAIVLHIYSAVTLWRRAKLASPTTYEAKRRLAQTYSARTMRWGGIILAGLLIFHLASSPCTQPSLPVRTPVAPTRWWSPSSGSGGWWRCTRCGW